LFKLTMTITKIGKH